MRNEKNGKYVYDKKRMRDRSGSQWIGLLDDEDVDRRGVIFLGPRPVKKAILLVFMPHCPHCKTPKADMDRLDVRRFGVEKLAIDASRRDMLAKRVPKIFGFPKSEYTVPRIYVIENGRPIKELTSIKKFHPVNDFARGGVPNVKKSVRISRRRPALIRY